MSDHEHSPRYSEDEKHYLLQSLGNLDGSMCHQDIEEFSTDPSILIAQAKDMCNEHGSECYIYECRPIYRIVRGKAQVHKLTLDKKKAYGVGKGNRHDK